MRRDVVEGSILEALKTQLMDPDLVAEFARAFTEEANRLRWEQNAQFEVNRTRLAGIERRIGRIVAAISEGESAKALTAELNRLEAEQDELEHNLAADPERPIPLIHPNLAEIYRHKVAELDRLLEEKETRDEAMEAIRALIDRVVLTPEDGELQIDLQGELAAILNLCNDSRKPAEQVRDGLEQIKLVAGARNPLKPLFDTPQIREGSCRQGLSTSLPRADAEQHLFHELRAHGTKKEIAAIRLSSPR